MLGGDGKGGDDHREGDAEVLTQPSSTLPVMLTDEEAAEIRRKLGEGWRGPVLITWLYRLLDD